MSRSSTTTSSIFLIFFSLLPFLIIASVDLDHPGPVSNPGPASSSSSSSFWLRTAVEQLRVRDACISAQLCAEPRLTLLNQMPKYNERISQEWTLAKASVPGITLDLFTFWERGVPTDINIQVLVQGVDPKFKFARVCDESSAVSVYQIGHPQIGQDGDEHAGRVRLELHGQCFNATLNVDLFRHRCPWCPSEKELQEASAHLMSDQQLNSSLLCQFPFRTNFLILLLAFATAINVLAFIGLLIICVRQRKNGQNLGEEKSPNDGHRQNFLANSSENRFIIPRFHLPPVPSMPPHQNFLPTIAEEFYEVIDDDHVPDWRPQIPPHFQNTNSRCPKEPRMVQLPLSSKCDHCFLRLQGDDRCSCTSRASSVESNFGCQNNSSFEEGQFAGNGVPPLNTSTTSNFGTNSSNGNARDSGLDGSNHSDEMCR